ncbi:MAG: HlyD family efflux transporter periplasmic adaptor subunit [Candidatus Paceibacterota bacterium]|jgi:HlyD family secretion protein
MKNLIKKTKKFIVKHKIISIIILIVVVGGLYFIFKGNREDQTRYIVSNVKKGTIIASVSGTGQVSVENQISLKSKVGGDVLSINVKNGQEVKAGDLVIQLNSKDARKTVRDAELSLKTALLDLEKLQKPADALSLLQAQNALTQAQNDLIKGYDDGFNAVANAFIDLPNVITGVDGILFSGDLSGNTGQWNADYYASEARLVNNDDGKSYQYKEDAVNKFNLAKTAYDKNFSDYKNTTRYSDTIVVENLINETYDTTKLIAEAVKSSTNLIQFYQDRKTSLDLTPIAVSYTHLTSLSGYTTKTNTNLTSLLNIKNTIYNNTKYTVPEKTQSLADLKDGADEIDVESKKLSIEQKQNTLQDAKDKLADYSIRAPFDGTIASIDVKKSDSVLNGGTVGTLITKQKIAEISLNEIDIAKIKIGQKTTLTFDAIEDLSITGEVSEIDSIGTNSQGVVTYNVKIIFDTQDDRVKSGMSVSASIITDIRQDVLIVPNNSVKSLNGSNYIEIFTVPLIATEKNTSKTVQGIASSEIPTQQTVEIGISNDTDTEIVSGLNEGDQIIQKTIIPATSKTKTTTQAPSMFGGGPATRSSSK